ncbi:MAG: MBL fold metallo-hydrolase [Candidatus Heimdallarchaeota archaeon]
MKLLILGSGQDAGVPQINCDCENCSNARKNPDQRRLGPTIAFLDKEKEYCYIIDASPDMKDQTEIIKKAITKVKSQKSIPISGIFLTHAHYGHCSGLWSLGKECCDADEVMVFCSAKMSEFLKNNHPFQHLFERKNLALFSIKMNYEYSMEDFTIKAFKVPHRDEYADTVGYLIEHTKKVIYLPDLDYWTEDLIELINSVDIAIIDGSFYNKGELPRMTEIPHPPIIKTAELFKDSKVEIYFTHFNHTNPILKENSKERNEILKKGFKIARDGLVIDI